MRIAIVRSSYYEELLSSLETSAREELEKGGIPEGSISTLAVSGSFEIPLACQHLLKEKNTNGIVALGVIIEGETFHANEIARACTDGLMHLQLKFGVPIAHGVLYCKTLEQAQERCRGEKNRGAEAARTLLHMLALLHRETHIET